MNRQRTFWHLSRACGDLTALRRGTYARRVARRAGYRMLFGLLRKAGLR